MRQSRRAQSLNRLFQLAMFGVGATIGTSIFVLSEAVPEAGPAVVLSFLIAAASPGLTAVCCAELSAVPVSGSSYSYAYATIGELPAMAVAGCLLEYGVSGAAVAVGWSQYLNELLNNLFGVQIRKRCPRRRAGRDLQPAAVLILLCTCCSSGCERVCAVNTVMVLIKIIILLFIIVGFRMELK